MITQLTVDHRYAQSQLRYRLLQQLVFLEVTLEEVSAKAGLSVQHLTAFCLGKGGMTYRDMARLAKGLMGEPVELLVAMNWVECGQSYSCEEPCPEDDENQKMLVKGQESGKIPLSVCPRERSLTMSPPNLMDVELVEGSFAPYELKVPCPACGSTDNWFKVETRAYTPPFGTTTRYEVTILHCTNCTEELDYEPGPDPKRVSAILQHADQATVPVMLDRLEAAGISHCAIKRVFALADPTDWRTGTKASTIALLRILTTYPWILEVASRHFDPEVAQTVLHQAAQVETTNQGATVCENCGKKLLGNPDDCPCWEADYRWG